MLTANEMEYCQGIIKQARAKGCRYYLIHTITESGEDNDFCIYLSDSDILCNSPYSFSVPAGRKITVDSSQSYRDSTGNHVVNSAYSGGTVTINNWEFAYSNGEMKGETLIPDLHTGGENNEMFKAFGIVVTMLLLVIVLFRLFRD